MKNLIVKLPILLLVLLLSACTKKPSSSSSMDVYSTFSCNGKELGRSKSISLTSITNWMLTKQTNNDQISLGFTSPEDGKTYSGFFINSPKGSNFRLGTNTNCTLSLMNGNTIYSSSNLTVTITHFPSAVNDYCEGTFTGIVSVTSTSPISFNDYASTGSFKVPLK
jgi:hypothetical protein